MVMKLTMTFCWMIYWQGDKSKRGRPPATEAKKSCQQQQQQQQNGVVDEWEEGW